MLSRVQDRKDSIVISRDGKPVAALVDAQMFEQIQRMQTRFDEATAKIAKAFENIPEEEGMAMIEEAIAEVRRGER
jgi:prevent-host-death family protein